MYSSLTVDVGDGEKKNFIRKDILSDDVGLKYPLLWCLCPDRNERASDLRYAYVKKRDFIAYESIKSAFPTFKPSPLVPPSCMERLIFILEDGLYHLRSCIPNSSRA